MALFRYMPPTAGIPLQAADFLSALLARTPGDCLEHDFRQYLQAPYARVTCSGTAALYLIAEALKEISPQRTVIIPSLICPLAPLAIRRAGLRVEVCDVGRDHFNFDPAQLDAVCTSNADIAAVVVVHLAGLPANLDAVMPVAERHGVYVIEDCAQALGAAHQGRKVGTIGDFSFFSLAAGKGLTLYEGGVLVTRSQGYARVLDAAYERFICSQAAIEALRVLQLLGYWIFYRPALFWFVFRLPQLFWSLLGKRYRAAREDFSLDFPLHAVSLFRKRLGHGTFPCLEEQIPLQRQRAEYLINGLQRCSGIALMQEAPGDRATYPYVTVVFDDPAKKRGAETALRKAGLGPSFVYADAIADYDYMRDMVPDHNCTNARYLAARALTLSTSPFLAQPDLDAMLTIIRRVLKGQANRPRQ